MKYSLVLSDAAVKDLKKLDKYIAGLILNWMRKNLNGIENPRVKGKALVGNFAGAWRYRVGDYRIIAHIKDDSLVILAVAIRHRREVYQ